MDTTKENLTNATSLADAGSPATVTDHSNDESADDAERWWSNIRFDSIMLMLVGLIIVLFVWRLLPGFRLEICTVDDCSQGVGVSYTRVVSWGQFFGFVLLYTMFWSLYQWVRGR